MAARRRRRLEPAPADPQPEFDAYSSLVSHLLVRWAWGRLPATEVQAVCKAALRDRIVARRSRMVVVAGFAVFRRLLSWEHIAVVHLVLTAVLRGVL